MNSATHYLSEYSHNKYFIFIYEEINYNIVQYLLTNNMTNLYSFIGGIYYNLSQYGEVDIEKGALMKYDTHEYIKYVNEVNIMGKLYLSKKDIYKCLFQFIIGFSLLESKPFYEKAKTRIDKYLMPFSLKNEEEMKKFINKYDKSVNKCGFFRRIHRLLYNDKVYILIDELLG